MSAQIDNIKFINNQAMAYNRVFDEWNGMVFGQYGKYDIHPIGVCRVETDNVKHPISAQLLGGKFVLEVSYGPGDHDHIYLNGEENQMAMIEFVIQESHKINSVLAEAAYHEEHSIYEDPYNPTETAWFSMSRFCEETVFKNLRTTFRKVFDIPGGEEQENPFIKTDKPF